MIFTRYCASRGVSCLLCCRALSLRQLVEDEADAGRTQVRLDAFGQQPAGSLAEIARFEIPFVNEFVARSGDFLHRSQ
jgi:hypothetical protein